MKLDNKRVLASRDYKTTSPVCNLVRRASFQPGSNGRGPLSTLNLNNYLNVHQNIDSPKQQQQRDSPLTQLKSLPNYGGDKFQDEENEQKIGDLEDLLFGGENRQEATINEKDHHEIIKHSLEIEATCSNLIGDRSKQLVLPIIPSAKHQDLHCISPETVISLKVVTSKNIKNFYFNHPKTKKKLVGVLNGEFTDQIDEYVIIDSRYPYEFDGGHIHNALNIFTKDKLYEEMFLKRLNTTTSQTSRTLTQTTSASRLTDLVARKSTSLEVTNKQKRVIIIFHCEFSSERGPSLLRFLRNQDRAINQDIYPYLHYPELYLLEGGYKSFYENFKVYKSAKFYFNFFSNFFLFNF